MLTRACDILIVGLGPAGSSAAISASRSGLKVLAVEQKAEVGRPVRCAEYIPALLLGEIKGGKDFIVQSVKGMRTILPDGEIVETSAPGFTVQRDLFDQTLAREAEKSGAELWLSSRVLEKNDDGILVRGKDGYRRIKAKIIIGADGPRSRVGRWIGSVNRNMIPALQASVPLVRPMALTEVYFDKDIYGGYGWVFPKGKEANVGIGKRQRKNEMRPIQKTLELFINRLIAEGKIRDRISRVSAGWIPAEGPRKVTRDHILLAGDAAGQTHPISGAGVPQAVICGRMAGQWAARAAEEGDLRLLSRYEEEWQGLFGESQERAFNRRQLLEREWDRLGEIIRTCWVAFRDYYA